MYKRFIIICFLLFANGHKAQTLREMIKEKEAKLKEAANFGKNADKKKAEYDESNFNYAISFLDNSGLFEAEEKGNAWTSALINSTGMGSGDATSDESLAYNNLRQGEALMAGNRMYLASQSFVRAASLYEKAGKANTGNFAQVIGDFALLNQNRGLYAKAMPYCVLTESIDVARIIPWQKQQRPKFLSVRPSNFLKSYLIMKNTMSSWLKSNPVKFSRPMAIASWLSTT